MCWRCTLERRSGIAVSGPYAEGVVVLSHATVRLYGDLAAFLPQHERSTEITFGVPGSIKDAVEALGVPHTEVDVVLLDGEPVGWEARLRPGARIAVYPWFHRFDVAGSSPVHVPIPDPARFVADVHLARMARYLRLAGCDVLHSNDYDDTEIVDIALAEERIVVTRDVGLLKRAAVRNGYFVRAVAALAQASEVVRRFGLAASLRPFTRCMACNGVLEMATEKQLGDQIPAAAAASHSEFHRCPQCGRAYWKGSHHRRLREIVDALRLA